MTIYLDELDSVADAFALYIDGDFQFETTDEALYHESLALPPLCLAATAGVNGSRVLICGGGDGLALRECLRFPGIVHVDLVDYSDDVVDLGRTRLSAVNASAFSDPRVSVHLTDAWEFLTSGAAPYDVILCDFTVPRKHEDTRVFSVEWYRRLKSALSPGGVLGINAVSPQVTPEAFWCLIRTIKAAGLCALPYHVCIPSFRAHGYGAWAFVLASHTGKGGGRSGTLTVQKLKTISCPVPTRQADLTKLWRGARFPRRERALEKRAPINTLANGCLLPLLLNPGAFDFERGAYNEYEISPYDLNPLLRAIPISHPYHTRIMVEALAEQVAGTVRDLDIGRLIEALLRKAVSLPAKLMQELTRLRTFLQDHTLPFELFSEWSYRLFAALVIMMTLANGISPDNAFAKGSFGSGAHGGYSVGHSSFSSEGSSFNGSPGSRSTGRSSTGSFGDENSGRSAGSNTRSSGGPGYYGGGESGESNSLFSTPSSPRFTGSGFRTSYGQGRAVDILGVNMPARSYWYCGSGYGHYHPYTQVYGGTRPSSPPEKHSALFLASDDMSVLDNGDVVVSVSDTAYLLLTNATVALMSSSSPDPIIMMYPDPTLFANVHEQIVRQQASIRDAIVSRADWLSWVGWTSTMVPAVAGDRQELNNLKDLKTRLDTAAQRLGRPPDAATSTTPGRDQIELFIGAVLMQDGTISLRGANGSWINTDGRALHSSSTGDNVPALCPPMLTAALKSSLGKLRKDAAGGIASDQYDIQQRELDNASLQNDLSQYQGLQSANYGDPNYEVDYGTDEIPVWDAISRTQRDLTQNSSEREATQKDIDRLQEELTRIDAAVARFGS